MSPEENTEYTGRESPQPELDWPEHGPVFCVGDLVAGRYRVTRLLGQGAMGEVHSVHDLELASEVALKVLHVGAHADRESVERFKREILLARRVSHPNVCRIFDLGVHLLEATQERERRPVLFLTMELLEGQTLVQRIEESGPLSESEALAIARQLGDALEAAHRAGVVHRDFKSSNILLVPGPAGMRAVVTDFGLAREQRPDGHGKRLTETGGVLGTPAYMSPEQVEGKLADARSDIYAFGVVLYEMLTGRFPFEGESPISMALKRLKEPPKAPEIYRPDLSLQARAALRRCLARDPADRFASALDAVRALAGTPGTARAWVGSRMAAAIAATLALVVILGIRFATRPREAPPASRTESVRPSFAVLPLRNATGRPESEWLSTALAEMLTTELAAGESLRAVPGETVARAVRDLEIVAGETLAADSLDRLRRNLGAEIALIGSYSVVGNPGTGSVRVDLRLQPTAGGALRPFSVDGQESDLFAMVARLGEELRSALGASPPAPEAVAAARAALPQGDRAVRLYSEALDLIRRGEAVAARERLETALAEEPGSPLVWAALSETWTRLGYEQRAAEAAREAYERRGSLPRVEALAIEGRFRSSLRDWPAAIEIGHALWRLFRDDPEYGLRLAQALLDAGRAGEALAVVGELKTLPPPADADPRIDLYEARAADALSELKRSLEAALRAAEKARAAGSRSHLARALYEEGIARRKLGEPEASRRALVESRRLAGEAGDRNGAAMAILSVANLDRAAGRLDEAAALYAEARAVFIAIGNRQREARAELSQGLVLSQQGEIARALDLYRAALEKFREVVDRSGTATALSNIGSLLYESGDLSAALEQHEEAMREFRALGDETKIVVSLQNQAQIRQDRGDLAGARRDLEEELEIARRIGDRTGEGYALKGLADLELERGALEEADARYAQAIELFRTLEQTPWRLYAEMGRAVLARELGRAAESAEQLEVLASEFSIKGMNDDRDEALLNRLRALVAISRLDEALPGAPELLARARTSDVQRLRHLERFARAELALAERRYDEAFGAFSQEVEVAREAGLALLVVEARAGLAQLAFLRRDPRAVQLAASALEEATRLGAGRVARRLATLTSPAS